MIQRAQRQRSGKPTVAVLGYTNAGKTSLVVRAQPTSYLIVKLLHSFRRVNQHRSAR